MSTSLITIICKNDTFPPLPPCAHNYICTVSKSQGSAHFHALSSYTIFTNKHTISTHLQHHIVTHCLHNLKLFCSPFLLMQMFSHFENLSESSSNYIKLYSKFAHFVYYLYIERMISQQLANNVLIAAHKTKQYFARTLRRVHLQR